MVGLAFQGKIKSGYNKHVESGGATLRQVHAIHRGMGLDHGVSTGHLLRLYTTEQEREES
jgi:hypothetical protein